MWDSFVLLKDVIAQGGRITLNGGDYELPGPKGITYLFTSAIGEIFVRGVLLEDEDDA
jgi:hypothetical protein